LLTGWEGPTVHLDACQYDANDPCGPEQESGSPMCVKHTEVMKAALEALDDSSFKD
jgi:hypothetical protein